MSNNEGYRNPKKKYVYLEKFEAFKQTTEDWQARTDRAFKSSYLKMESSKKFSILAMGLSVAAVLITVIYALSH